MMIKNNMRTKKFHLHQNINKNRMAVNNNIHGFILLITVAAALLVTKCHASQGIYTQIYAL